jgi:hypothetical protein
MWIARLILFVQIPLPATGNTQYGCAPVIDTILVYNEILALGIQWLFFFHLSSPFEFKFYTAPVLILPPMLCPQRHPNHHQHANATLTIVCGA